MTPRDWALALLKDRGTPLNGWVEPVQVTAWSWVDVIPTDAGTFFLKATEGFLAHEPKTTALLASWFPEDVAEVVAIEPTQAWLLMRDAGPTLRETQGKDLFVWHKILRRYAEMQVEASDRVETLRSTGCPSWSSERLSVELDRAVRTWPVPDDLVQALRSAAPRIEATAQELADSPFGETLHHDDLHGGNVYGQGPFRIADWGESGIAMPFLGLPLTLRSAAADAGFAPDSGEVRSLLHGYREVWTRSLSRLEFDEAWELAQRVGPLMRALTWSWIIPMARGFSQTDAQSGFERNLRFGIAGLQA